MSQVSLRAYNPVEVDILGSLYESVDLPEAKAERSGRIFDRLDEIARAEQQREFARVEGKTLSGAPRTEAEEKAIDEESRTLTLEWFDLVLKPAEDGKKKASTVLKAGLSAGKVTPRQLTLLFQDTMLAIARENAGPTPEQLAEAAEANGDRPT